MLLFRTTALAVSLAFAVSLNAAAAPVDQNGSAQDIDRSSKPGDDFYRYANGGWLGTAAIPAGQSSYDTRAMLVQKTGQRVHDLIQDAAACPVRQGQRCTEGWRLLRQLHRRR